jgi:hypothetical protein
MTDLLSMNPEELLYICESPTEACGGFPAEVVGKAQEENLRRLKREAKMTDVLDVMRHDETAAELARIVADTVLYQAKEAEEE